MVLPDSSVLDGLGSWIPPPASSVLDGLGSRILLNTSIPGTDNFVSRYFLLAGTRLPDSSPGFLRQMTFPSAVPSPVLANPAFFPGMQSKVMWSL